MNAKLAIKQLKQQQIRQGKARLCFVKILLCQLKKKLLNLIANLGPPDNRGLLVISFRQEGHVVKFQTYVT